MGEPLATSVPPGEAGLSGRGREPVARALDSGKRVAFGWPQTRRGRGAIPVASGLVAALGP